MIWFLELSWWLWNRHPLLYKKEPLHPQILGRSDSLCHPNLNTSYVIFYTYTYTYTFSFLINIYIGQLKMINIFLRKLLIYSKNNLPNTYFLNHKTKIYKKKHFILTRTKCYNSVIPPNVYTLSDTNNEIINFTKSYNIPHIFK